MQSYPRIKIGYSRYVRVCPELLVIEDDEAVKAISLNLQRACKLVRMKDDVDALVKKVIEKTEIVDYRSHIGGGWFVSVTSAYLCVDIREWYLDKNLQLKPSRKGMALRLNEWADFVKSLPQIYKLRPAFEKEVPCYHQPSHGNQQSEC